MMPSRGPRVSRRSVIEKENRFLKATRFSYRKGAFCSLFKPFVMPVVSLKVGLAGHLTPGAFNKARKLFSPIKIHCRELKVSQNPESLKSKKGT